MFKPYVIAGSYDQYKAWMRRTNTHPDAAVFLCKFLQLDEHCHESGEVLYVGEYWNSPLYDTDALKRFERKIEVPIAV